MHLRRRNFLLNAAGLAVAGNAVGTDAFAQAPSIICRAYADRTRLDMTGRFILTAILECAGGNPRMYVPATWGYRGFRASVVDEKTGVTTDPSISQFHPPPPQMLNDVRNFVRMYPGMIVGDTREFDAKEFFPKPGVYRVFVGYLSPVSRAVTRVEDALVSDGGMINARAFSMTVV